MAGRQQAPDGWPAVGRACNDGAVTGPVIILIVLFVAIPVGVLVSGGVFAGVFGMLLRNDADTRNEGTEYVELGR